MTDILKLLEPAGENATDDIIRQIRSLLDSGDLQPGDKLPAERKLAEKFQVARSQVREAFKKLEFYNIIKTMPQSGSVISAIESTALNSLISDILKMDNCDFHSLVEARSIIEINAAKLCAIRRTEEDLKMIESAMNNYNKKIKECGSALEEDLYFHRTIAEGSKNTVLKSMMMTITPDIMVNYAKFNVCKTNFEIPISEHRLLFEYIKNNNAEAASNIMSQHLTGVLNFAKTQQIVL
ncbi:MULTISPECIES: FadR/GntR family transcriptional regulator [Bacteroides]|jgi:GntR family transcriptional repressor for pyruvate dehydrogenase complex|uniref:FadR family transcriptional regulator n=3 Tax=Bacteroides TaxID=816 RepID=A0A412DCN8_BACSE|nr:MULTISPECIES: FadR/GntR family transcriptional regulator [Bacteroides]EGF51447.1 FCD domain protein [Bacteroides clarus YIT 12056]MBD9145336.1 FadR family transcriptional regulator [Bacteroides clarus]MBV1679516.1 FadR family transcriptional regulator [Bacteroides stercoris]MDC2316142.1 FadR/GntR family transcriptional regulator [Bacteroides stercoris]MDC2319277.1 FadR/GntR family transcriptional regulator [Bacteroides stercoris]